MLSDTRPSPATGLSLLRSVGEEVVSDWSREPLATPIDESRAAAVLEELLKLAGSADGGSPPVWSLGGDTDLHLCNRVLREIRVRLLEAWRRRGAPLGDVDPSEVLWSLDRIEQIRLNFWPRGDEELAHRYSGPDAFDLLVEVAHDIRSPLSSIMFLSETLRRGRSGDVNDLQRRQLGLVYSAALGLQSVTNDVVDSARGGRGLMDTPEPFSLAEVFDGIQELVRPVAEEKTLTVEFRRPGHDRFLGHPLPLSRTLLNLTTNALKFTEFGGVTVSAEWVDRGTLEFVVADTGRGMNEKQLRHLYQPFRKSEYRSGHFFSGSGLGLSIARRFLAAMGSELFVESEVGVGTRFWFRLALPPAPSL